VNLALAIDDNLASAGRLRGSKGAGDIGLRDPSGTARHFTYSFGPHRHLSADTVTRFWNVRDGGRHFEPF
jgi:hypothetical protein